MGLWHPVIHYAMLRTKKWSRISLWHGAIGHRFGYRSRRGQWQRGTFGWTTSKTRVTTLELRYSLASGTHPGLKKGRISNKCDLDPQHLRIPSRDYYDYLPNWRNQRSLLEELNWHSTDWTLPTSETRQDSIPSWPINQTDLNNWPVCYCYCRASRPYQFTELETGPELLTDLTCFPDWQTGQTNPTNWLC